MRTPLRGLVIGTLGFVGVLIGSERPTPAQVSVEITPPRIEVAPPAVLVDPRPRGRRGYQVWVEGHREWNGRRYVWVPGHWEYWSRQPPRHWYRNGRYEHPRGAERRGGRDRREWRDGRDWRD